MSLALATRALPPEPELEPPAAGLPSELADDAGARPAPIDVAAGTGALVEATVVDAGGAAIIGSLEATPPAVVASSNEAEGSDPPIATPATAVATTGARRKPIALALRRGGRDPLRLGEAARAPALLCLSALVGLLWGVGFTAALALRPIEQDWREAAASRVLVLGPGTQEAAARAALATALPSLRIRGIDAGPSAASGDAPPVMLALTRGGSDPVPDEAAIGALVPGARLEPVAPILTEAAKTARALLLAAIGGVACGLLGLWLLARLAARLVVASRGEALMLARDLGAPRRRLARMVAHAASLGPGLAASLGALAAVGFALAEGVLEPFAGWALVVLPPLLWLASFGAARTALGRLRPG